METHAPYHLREVRRKVNKASYDEIVKSYEDGDWSLHSWVLSPSVTDNKVITEILDAGKRVKWTSTRLGENIYLNNKVQGGRWADLREPRLMTFDYNKLYLEVYNDVSAGMGRYFSEQIDDHVSMVHIRPGVVHYSSMFGYMIRSYDPVLDYASRDGVLNQWAFDIGQTIGFISGCTLVIQGTLFALKTLDAVLMGTSSEYATVKPTSVLVWRRAQTILDSMLTSLQWRPDQSVVAKNFEDNLMGTNNTHVTPDELKAYNKLMGDVFHTPDGGFDLRAVATRAMRVQHYVRDIAMKEYQKSLVDKNADINYDNNQAKIVKAQLDLLGNPTKLGALVKAGARDNEEAWLALSENGFYRTESNIDGPQFETLLDKMTSDNAGVENSKLSNNAANTNVLDKVTKDAEFGYDSLSYNNIIRLMNENSKDESKKQQLKAQLNSWSDYLSAELEDGSAFFTFAVSGNSTASETFSNTAKEPLIKSCLSSFGSRFRDLSASTAGGNLIPGLGDLIGAAGAMLAGAADGYGVGGLAGIFAAANPSIPDIPDSSSATLQPVTIEIDARPPYGTTVSKIQNMFVIQAILLALSTAYSTGYQSYGMPPVIEYYQKGFAQSRFGMVSSFAVTRGVGNKGWARDGSPLGMKFVVELIPLAKDVHFPLISNAVGWRGTSSISTYVSKALYDQDNVGKDYIQCITATDIQHQIYGMRKIARNFQNAYNNIRNTFTKANVAQTVMDLPVINIGKDLAKGNYLIR